MPLKDEQETKSELLAPLSGQIIAIHVKVGDEVTLGQELLSLTAMKMENIITSERAGKIAKIVVSELDSVNSGQVLLEFEEK